MALEHLQVRHHVIPAAYIRGTHRGSRQDGSIFRLAVNQYTTKKASEDPNAFTIIAAHGISSSKESFEPFFDGLVRAGVPIRNIWIADAAYNGESYQLNKHIIGDELHWLDYSRDIFQMINFFQEQMPPPLVALGHSLGVGVLSVLSQWHPRLFCGMAAIEPGFGPDGKHRWPTPPKYFPGVLSMRRKDTWPSRDDAAKDLARSQFYKNFDPRVFQRVVQYELRDIRPEDGIENQSLANGVTLTTPKEIETYMWILPDPPLKGFLPPVEHNAPRDRISTISGLIRPEAIQIYESLPHIYPPMLYVWGQKSPLSYEERRKNLLALTGSGIGGNGGLETGAVSQAFVNTAHMALQENPDEVVIVIEKWLKDLSKSFTSYLKQKQNGPPFVKGVQPELIQRLEKL